MCIHSLNHTHTHTLSQTQPERLSDALIPDPPELGPTPMPSSDVDVDLEEFPEHPVAVDTIPKDVPLARGDMASMVNYRTLPGAMVRAQRSSQCISVTVADLCIYKANPRASNEVFVLVVINVNTLKATRATLFNIHDVAVAEAMTDFVTTLGKDEIVVAAAHGCIPSNCSRMVVDVLRSLQSVGARLHVLDSPYVQVGAKRPYLLEGLRSEAYRPGNAAVGVHVRVIQIPLETIAAMRTGGPVPMLELEGTHHHGHALRLPMDTASRPLPNDAEWLVFRDVTAEVRLRQVKAIVDTFQNLPGVILVTTDMELHLGIDGDVLGVTGYSANEFLALNPARDFLSPDADFAEIASLFASVVDPNQSFVEANIPHVHKDGHTIWLRACHGTRAIGTAANGKPLVLVVFSDVTATVVAQRIRDRCVELVPVMVYEMEADDATGTRRIVYASPKCTLIFGLTPDEMTSSRKWTEMLHPDDAKRYEASIAESQASMQEWDLEFRVVVEGETKYLHGRAVPRREATRVVWNGVLQDVSASHDHRMMASKRDIQKAIAERFEAACAFLSHEIRNQLHPHSAVLDMIKDKEPMWRSKIDLILTAHRTVSTLLSRVFDLAKWESGEFPINKTLFPITRLFEAIAACAQANSATVEGLASIMPTWHARADEELLKQAATNLVSNAFKFSDGRAVVVVLAFEQTTDREAVIVVTVTDQGRGMTPDQLCKVLVPFGQLRKGGDASTGTGLGLPLTKAMVETGHKGTLTLASEGLGKGTTATMRVPVAWEERHEEARQESDPLWWVTPHPGVTADVLVVDDVKMARMMVTREANKFGLTFDEAGDGVEAVERLRTNTYSVVFMDRQMPNMNGDVATEQARENGYALPIVMVSGDLFEASEELELKRRGMTAFLNKMSVPGVRDAVRKLNDMKSKNVKLVSW